MYHLAKLNDLAAAEIEELNNLGIFVTPQDVIEINALCWAIETPETRRDLSRGRPVKCGNVWLWPPTIRAIDWMDRNEYDVSKVTPAMGYALAHGRSDGNELDAEGREAEKAVAKWYKSLKVTNSEFRECVLQVQEYDTTISTPADPDGKPITLGDFSAHLAAITGQSPDFWERMCSATYAASVLTMIVLQNHADKRPSEKDPRIIAEIALARCLDRIKKRCIK